LKHIARDLWLNHQKKVRFVLVGVWNTIFGYLIFVACDYLFEHFFSPRYIAYMSAAVVSNLLAITNAYIFHKRVTFQSRTKGSEALFEYLRFSMTYLFTFVLALIMLPIGVEIFSLDPKLAAAIVTLILTGVSYITHDKFSFRSE
jgi:putative flippase GtrA